MSVDCSSVYPNYQYFACVVDYPAQVPEATVPQQYFFQTTTPTAQTLNSKRLQLQELFTWISARASNFAYDPAPPKTPESVYRPIRQAYQSLYDAMNRGTSTVMITSVEKMTLADFQNKRFQYTAPVDQQRLVTERRYLSFLKNTVNDTIKKANITVINCPSINDVPLKAISTMKNYCQLKALIDIIDSY